MERVLDLRRRLEDARAEATCQALPVAFGVVAEDQFAERIFALTARETGSNF